MYLLLTTALAGSLYYAYNQYFNPPTKKTGGAKSKKVKAVVVADKGKQYPDVKPYEEEWIPAEHLKSRQPKMKKRSGASSGGEDFTSGGDLTSGGETSGAEIKKGKKKGKKA
jgi:translocon-associated protein subunit alpha